MVGWEFWRAAHAFFVADGTLRAPIQGVGNSWRTTLRGRVGANGNRWNQDERNAENNGKYK
jgi:hypothetical protein